MSLIIFILSLLILVIVWNPFNTNFVRLFFLLFRKNEKDNILQDYVTHESYFYGLEKYLKEEGFYVKDLTNNDSITISW